MIEVSPLAAVDTWIDNVTVKLIPPTHCTLMLHLMLGGGFDHFNNTMTTALRTAGLVPLTEPYTALGYPQMAGGGGEAIMPGLLEPGIVRPAEDWVRVELRSAADPAVVMATRQVVVDRFGIACGHNGEWTLQFGVPPGNYYVAVRHRNHLGVMTALPITLYVGGLPTLVNFSSTSTATWGSNA